MTPSAIKPAHRLFVTASLASKETSGTNSVKVGTSDGMAKKKKKRKTQVSSDVEQRD